MCVLQTNGFNYRVNTRAARMKGAQPSPWLSKDKPDNKNSEYVATHRVCLCELVLSTVREGRKDCTIT